MPQRQKRYYSTTRLVQKPSKETSSKGMHTGEPMPFRPLSIRNVSAPGRAKETRHGEYCLSKIIPRSGQGSWSDMLRGKSLSFGLRISFSFVPFPHFSDSSGLQRVDPEGGNAAGRKRGDGVWAEDLAARLKIGNFETCQQIEIRTVVSAFLPMAEGQAAPRKPALLKTRRHLRG
jgi:hypothetical protein